MDLRPCRNVDSDGQLQLGSPHSMLSMKRFGSLRRSKKRKEQDGLSGRHQSEASCLCGNHRHHFNGPLMCTPYAEGLKANDLVQNVLHSGRGCSI